MGPILAGLGSRNIAEHMLLLVLAYDYAPNILHIRHGVASTMFLGPGCAYLPPPAGICVQEVAS